jgi:DUF2934 family protein
MQPRKTTTTDSQISPAPFGQSQQGSSSSSSSYGGRRPSQQEIAKRAYEIYKSGKGGSDVENWVRAERELRAA